jgi:hypothetical protein
MATKITALSSQYAQKIIQIINGVQVNISFRYFSSISRWVISEIQYNDFTRRNIPILPNQRLLDKWRNILQFDLICFTEDNLPPFDIEAFTLGNASNDNAGLFILQGEELEAFNTIYADI